MNLLLGLIVIIFLWLIFLKRKELFKPMNVFNVDDKKIQNTIPDFPINDIIDIDISNFTEQNKDTFDSNLKDTLVYLIQQKIGNGLKVFKDSMEKIFVDNDFKNIVFNINVYDTSNFFVYKIKVHISSTIKIDNVCQNCNIRITSYNEKKIDSVKFVPIEEPSVPVYFRILNTLHLLDPFKTSSIL